MAAIMVRTENLTKRFGRIIALDGLSLEVTSGQILALVGPNGAGKTTALKLMVGLLSPSEGCVSIAGFDVYRQSLEAKRRLSFIPDQPFLYEQLTIKELLGFIGGVYQMDPETFEHRANWLLELFALKDLLSHRISQLSYGMKSRLVLVASLLHDPEVLIMDEPFFGLDPQTLRLMKQLLRERSDAGLTVVLSTHQLPIVEDVAHRIAIISQGKLLALGSLAQLKQRYGGDRLEELFFHITASS